jgi:DNA-binding NtrC family response regulator
LYLDSIADMSPRLQVDLLRVLQESNFTPIGESNPIDIDVRLVASSQVPLDQLVDSGQLRRDLLYRLQVVTIDIPPLRERLDDILLIARQVLDREATRLGQEKRSLSPEAALAMGQYAWPGNVRELEQVIRKALIVGDGYGAVSKEELFGNGPARGVALKKNKKMARSMNRQGEDECIIEALERCQWNRTRAAQLLGIPRRTFYRRLKKLGIVGNSKKTQD